MQMTEEALDKIQSNHPLMPKLTLAKFNTMPASVAQDWLATREKAIKFSEDDPYNFGHDLDSWKMAMEELQDSDVLLILGGNRCLDGNEELYNPSTNSYQKISEIKGETMVLAWDGVRLVPAKASEPFRKSRAKIYQVTLEDGVSFSCSGEHRVLLATGEYEHIHSLDAGALLYHPRTSLDIDPLVRDEGGQSFDRRPEGLKDDYFAYCHQCDELPQTFLESVRGFFQRQVDALKYSGYVSWRLGDRVRKFLCNRLYFECDHLSIQGGGDQTVDQFSGTLSGAFCKLYKSVWELFSNRRFDGDVRQSSSESIPPRSKILFVQQDNQYFSCFKGKDTVRVVKINYLRDDYVWDLTVPNYENYWHKGIIHHNSGKSEFCSKTCVRACMENPRTIIWCWSQNSKLSIEVQQRAVWRNMPKQVRHMNGKRKAEGNFNFSMKNGFSGNRIIFPNGSEIVFRNYAQYRQDPSIVEGGELGCKTPDNYINLGVWCDELVPLSLVQTLRYRLVTRNSKMIISFTPKDGYNETVANFLDRIVYTMESRPAELLNGEKVPLIQHCDNNDRVVYFHSQDNPFGGYNRLKEEIKLEPRDGILVRAYGVPTKRSGSVFPLFNEPVHVVRADQVPTEGTRYCVIDPAGRKPYFILWAIMDPQDRCFIYREFPNQVDYIRGVGVMGEWATLEDVTIAGHKTVTKADGYVGPGADPLGWGLKRYKELCAEFEGWDCDREDTDVEGWDPGKDPKEKIYERIIDSRYSGAARQTMDDSTTLLDQFAEINFPLTPAPTRADVEMIPMITEWLAYDPTEKVGFHNEPKLYISENCVNTIFALKHWTGLDGKDGACKDPIDCLKYLVNLPISYVGKENFTVDYGGSY